MNGFLLFLFIVTIAVVVFLLGRAVGVRVGYLAGKAEVSNIPRGEPPNDECIEREAQMMYEAKRGDPND